MTFWRNRSVLVTGHTGFKGSWLSLWLQQAGANVTGYSLDPPTTPSLFEQAHVARGMTSLAADVRDLPRLAAVMMHSAPEVVFHLAAQSLVRASYDDPVLTYATNVMGTVNVLEAARRIESVKAVVIVTTDKCYENRESLVAYVEDDRLGGHDPYSNSKACAELVTDAYRRSFATSAAIASVRAGNVIGGGDWARDRIVPDAIRAFLAGTPLVVRNPASVRPWQHVLEPLAGYLALAERIFRDRAFATAWNFGPADDRVMVVGDLAAALADAWGDGATWQVGASTGPHEAARLRLDSTKARERLSWTPKLSLEESLYWVVEWHKEVARGGDPRAITERQIERYVAR